MKSIFLIAFMATSALAAEDNCLSVIGASRISSTTWIDENEFERSASVFCTEYFKSSENRNSREFGASYEFLKLQFGDQSASSEQIAAKTCDSRENNKIRKSSYRSYAEQLAPGALDAYRACKELDGNSVTVNVIRGSKQLDLVVGYRQDAAKNSTAAVQYITNGPAECAWTQDSIGEPMPVSQAGTTIELKAGNSARLKCVRDLPASKSQIGIQQSDRVGKPMLISWGAENVNGEPIDDLNRLGQRLVQAEGKIESLLWTGRFIMIAHDNLTAGMETFTPQFTTGDLVATPDSNFFKAPQAGRYFASVSLDSCMDGSREYLGTSVVLNGVGIAGNSQKTDECGSSTTAIAFNANLGDEIRGNCKINQGMSTPDSGNKPEPVRGSCKFTVVYLGQ